jgi:hypothetical protein
MGCLVGLLRLFAAFLVATVVWSLVRRAVGGLARASSRPQRRPKEPEPRAKPQAPDPRHSPRLDPSIEDADYEELP